MQFEISRTVLGFSELMSLEVKAGKVTCLLEAEVVPLWAVFLPSPVGCMLSLPIGLTDVHSGPQSRYLEEGPCPGSGKVETDSTLMTQPWLNASAHR